MDVQPSNLMCMICKKGFSSGKDLGHHMKIHARDLSNGNADVLDFEARSDLINGGGTPYCSVCSKEFRTWKLLYMHMRSHPESEWLGIIAPHRRVRRGVVGDSCEQSELNNVVVKGLGSDPKKKKRKSENPNGHPGLGPLRFECPTCKKELSRWALGRHWFRHILEIRNGSRVSDPGPVMGDGSTREAGVMERSMEEGRSMEPDRSYQQLGVRPTLGLGGPSGMGPIGEFTLVVDLNSPTEP